MTSPFLSIKEVAARCGVTPRTLQYWRHRRFGPPFVRMGDRVRYLAAEFEAWFNSCRGP